MALEGEMLATTACHYKETEGVMSSDKAMKQNVG